MALGCTVQGHVRGVQLVGVRVNERFWRSITESLGQLVTLVSSLSVLLEEHDCG